MWSIVMVLVVASNDAMSWTSCSVPFSVNWHPPFMAAVLQDGRRPESLSELNLSWTELAGIAFEVKLPFTKKEVLRSSLMHGPG
jgi:hypothetical protein